MKNAKSGNIKWLPRKICSFGHFNFLQDIAIMQIILVVLMNYSKLIIWGQWSCFLFLFLFLWKKGHFSLSPSSPLLSQQLINSLFFTSFPHKRQNNQISRLLMSKEWSMFHSRETWTLLALHKEVLKYKVLEKKTLT